MHAVIDARLGAWLAPIETRVEEPRLHTTFEVVRLELAKLESASSTPPDWAAVLDAADRHLRTVGKDLLVASSLALALADRENTAGLAIGLTLVAELLERPDVEPARPRARANAVGFLVTTATAMWGLRAWAPPGAELERLARAVRRLEAGASGSLGETAPSLRPLLDHIERAAPRLPAPHTPAALAPPLPTPAAVFATPPPVEVPLEPAPSPPASIPTQLRKHASGLLETACAMSAATSFLDAEALRVFLVALYLPLTGLPPTTRGSRTALAPPPRLIVETLSRLPADAEPRQVARELLRALERHRLALDLHAQLDGALERAGADALDARRAHRHELAGLHARLPGLSALEFMDGTPFASSSTRELLDSLGASPVTRRTAAMSESSPLDAALDLVRNGKTTEALALASRAREEARSGREHFEATLTVASIAEQARALPMAEALHAALLREIDEQRLARWEPALTARAVSAYLRVAQKLPGQETLARELLGRLALVDPEAALALSRAHATPARTSR